MKRVIKSLQSYPIQAYLSSRVQLFDIIDDILQEVGKCDIYISTFSTSEEFLRRLYRLKDKHLIGSATLVADLKAMRKVHNLELFIQNVFDNVYLSENHSKVILLYNKSCTVTVATSQNQTRGNRAESGIITTTPEVFAEMMKGFEELIDKSIKINNNG